MDSDQMPTKSTYRKKAKYSKYKRAYKKARKGNYLNQRIKKVTLQQQELKWLTYMSWINGASATQAWQMWDFPIYSIVQGVTRRQRIGAKIYLQSVELTVKLAGITANTATNGSTCRFIIYHKLDCEGTITVIGDIFNNTTDEGVNITSITPGYAAQKTLEFYPKRATVIYDKMHSMYATTSDSAGLPTAVGPKWDCIINIPIMKQINFVGNAGTIADIRGHSWGLAFAADDTNCCNVTVDVRFRYKDA